MFRFRPIRDQPFNGLDKNARDIPCVDGYDAINSTFLIINIKIARNIEDEDAISGNWQGLRSFARGNDVMLLIFDLWCYRR